MNSINSFPFASVVRYKFYEEYKGKAYVDLVAWGYNRLEISHIFVEPADRGKGHASQALKLLTSLADQYQVELSLEVGGEGAGIDGDLGLLCEFYSRYGFCFEDSTMVRTPSFR